MRLISISQLLIGAQGLATLSFLTLVWYSTAAEATEANTSHYRSEVDESLTLRKIAIAPVIDNLQGIYGNPIQDELTSLIKKNHHLDIVDIKSVGPMLGPEEFSADPKQVQNFLSNSSADSLLAVRVTKNPQGIILKMSLFTGTNGLLLAEEELQNTEKSDIQTVRLLTRNLLSRIISRIPYQGLVLSRQENRVTVDVGSKDGVEEGQIVEVVQIFSASRHPKFQFLVGTEKDIIGKIKLHKVEPTLSFGSIISEKEKGAIQKNSKISGLKAVEYGTLNPYVSGRPYQTGIEQRQDQKSVFGEGPLEWKPAADPAFGQVGLAFGLGAYSGNLSLTSGGPQAASAAFYPNLLLSGQLWLTPAWIIDLKLKQAIFNTKNPLGGSSPSDLAHAVLQTSLRIGYNFLLTQDFFGPKIEFLLGVGSYRHFVDDSSPQSFTTVTYSGTNLGVRGSFPVFETRGWWLGAELNFFFNPKLSENPVTSGSSSNNTINSFHFFVENQLTANLRALISVDLDLYTSSFTGNGTRTDSATSASFKHTTLAGGINYLF